MVDEYEYDSDIEDLFNEQDAFVKNVDEWEMWDILRTYHNHTTIPREVQLRCHQKLRELNGRIAFYSFRVNRLLDELRSEMEQKIRMPPEFIWEDVCDDHEQDVLMETILLHNSDFFHQLYTDNPTLVFFGYDARLDRFIIFADTVDFAMDVEYGFENYIRQYAFRQMWLYVVNIFYSQEALRQRQDALYVHPPSSTEPQDVIRELEEMYESDSDTSQEEEEHIIHKSCSVRFLELISNILTCNCY